MREYGFEATGAHGELRTIYFTPMSYVDWLTHSDDDTMLEPSSVRYLIAKYVTRVHDEQNEQIDPLQLLDLPPNTLANLIRGMVSKSGFSDPEEFKKIMERLEYTSRTIMGAYDYFILAHMGPDIYLSMMDQSVHIRANLIAQIERYTGITVASRFEDSIREGMPLDVVSLPEQYEKNMYRMKKGRPLNKTNTGINNIPGVTKPQGTPPGDFRDLVAKSASALSSEMAQANKDAKAKRAFNWQADNLDMMKHAAAHDQDVLNQERQPPAGK